MNPMWPMVSGFDAHPAVARNLWRNVSPLILVGMLLSAVGCASFFSSGSPPQYFEIDYSPPAPGCARGWTEGVRLWPFSASAPYDRDEMMILDAEHKVRFSSVYRWVAVPGSMVADRLLRDLGQSPLFAHATASGNRLASALELSGHIHQFAWEEKGPEGKRAALDVEVTLWREEPKRDVIFKRHYRLESPASASGSSEAMAEALSQLVRELSATLQRDLCVQAMSY